MKIVIADSLVRSTLSPERQFHGIPSNVGSREVERCVLEEMRKATPGNGAQHDIMREAVRRATEALLNLDEEPEE